MKILIADKFQPWGIDKLEAAGCEVVSQPGVVGPAMVDAVARSGCDILIVRGTKVHAEVFGASPNLSLVIRAGAGYDTIDVSAASQRSVFVANCPGKNAAAVAELTLGLILALDRRIADTTADLKKGSWNKKLYSEARGLKGRTLGIVGKGQIGQLVAARALAFEMNVVAWSRSLTFEKAAEWGVRRVASIAEVAGACDILSVHLASTPETKRCIDAQVLGALAQGAYFINTSRGDVVDYDALLDAIKSRNVRVGLDVFEQEPSGGVAEFTDRVMQSGGIVCATPHIGASTDQAQDAIAEETVRIVTHFQATGEVLNCVNLCARTPARWLLLVRHLNRPGVLAHVLNVISHAQINVEEMQNVICEGAVSACAQIALDGPLSGPQLADVQRGNSHILGLSLKPIAS